eukprot:jgi/Bigna1/88147/estExt_fgenesh1_pg.C_280174
MGATCSTPCSTKDECDQGISRNTTVTDGVNTEERVREVVNARNHMHRIFAHGRTLGAQWARLEANIQNYLETLSADSTKKFEINNIEEQKTEERKGRLSCKEASKPKSSGSDLLPLATFLELVIDRSGSMRSMGKGPTEQIMELLREQQRTAKENQVPTFISLTTFDDIIETTIECHDLLTCDLPSMTTLEKWLRPRNRTRLIDTAIERLEALESNIQNYLEALSEDRRKQRSGKIAGSFMLLTDGKDNASVRPASDLKKRLEDARNKGGLKAYFLGANQDAITSGARYGFCADTAMTFSASKEHAKCAIEATSANIREYSCNVNSFCSYSLENRNRSLAPSYW